MPLSAEGSYALVSITTFLLVAALTLVACKLFDGSAPFGSSTTAPLATGAPPFPDAYPQLPPAAVAPYQLPQCVNYCTNSSTGALEPCATTKLQKCTTRADCDTCRHALPYQNIDCINVSSGTGAGADAYPSVAQAQTALKNAAPAFCLPTRESCIFTASAEDTYDPTPRQCINNNDCLRCTDQLPPGDKFTCQTVGLGAGVTLTNAAGESQVFPSLPAGQYCLPTTRGCDPRYGTATWTATEGWKCVCKYPSVMAGDSCDEVVACRRAEVTPWSKDKQTLLQNMRGVDGSAVGSQWTIKSGIDPNKCVDSGNYQVARLSSGACPTGTQPTVACQCDGVQEGTHATYRTVAGQPLTCELDPCFGNVNGGRTADNPTALPSIPYQPPTTCACSGAGSNLWEYSGQTGTSQWRGYCQPKTLPGTKIVIPAASPVPASCAVKPNTESNVSGLVPGKRTLSSSGSGSGSGLVVNACVADPCAGNYSDPLYRTQQSIGHFDASSGVCACFQDGSSVQAMLSPGFPNCDRTVNPVCSSCVDACQGADLNVLCPVYPNSINACGNRRCTTAPDGKKACDCGVDCFYYGGMCYPKVPESQTCEGLNGVPGACVSAEDSCQLTNSYNYDGLCLVGRSPVDAKVVCSKRAYCGQTTCGTTLPSWGGRKWEPCGGSSQVRFPKEGLRTLPPAAAAPAAAATAAATT